MSHPDPMFIADDPGLDLLNSIATPVDTVVDWIDNGEGLLGWLEQAGLVPADILRALRDQASPGEIDDVATRARSLRTWCRGFVEARMGRPLDAGDLEALAPLNQLLERDDAFSRIVARRDGEGLRLAPVRRWRTPEALLQPIGRALARLVCEVDFRDVKACEGHACTLLFVDNTRARGRRWCSMAVCGNRAKQAAHRDRVKALRAGGGRPQALRK